MNGKTIKTFFETRYPLETAYEWDNVGLQIGTLNKTLSGILIALDLTKETLTEAVDKDVNLIITHHPVIFTPLTAVLTDTYKGRLIKDCLCHDMSVYVAHTNYDVGENGMNKVLADRIGLNNQSVLEETGETHGIGRIGDVDDAPFTEFVEHVKKRLSLKTVRIIAHDASRPVKRVAVSGGSGTAYIETAKIKGADLYLTGDVRYHDALEMTQLGLRGLDIGHFAERHFAKALRAELNNAGITVPVHVSERMLDPFSAA